MAVAPGVKIGFPIFYVLLDGEIHEEAEIIARVRLFIPPNMAVRRMANDINSGRAHVRNKNRTGRVVLCTRKEPAAPEEMNVEQSIVYLVRTSLVGLRTNGYVVNDGTQWMLSDSGFQHVRQKHVAGSIANALRASLMLRGRLI